jgi:hypothetical protein
MPDDKAYNKLTLEVDKYLDSLSFERLMPLRPGEIYSVLYTALSQLAVRYYESLDATHNIELNVRKDFEEEFVELTGYIKLLGKFVWIENRYVPKKAVKMNG